MGRNETNPPRRTRQREAIAEVIRASAGPLTIEQIHERAARQSPNLGMATVYRTVNLMLELEEIRTVILPDGEARYEAADLGHHHHFNCRVCGQVFDLDHCPVKLPDGVLPGGFRVEDHELTLYGSCPDCVGDG